MAIIFGSQEAKAILKTDRNQGEIERLRTALKGVKEDIIDNACLLNDLFASERRCEGKLLTASGEQAKRLVSKRNAINEETEALELFNRDLYRESTRLERRIKTLGGKP